MPRAPAIPSRRHFSNKYQNQMRHFVSKHRDKHERIRHHLHHDNHYHAHYDQNNDHNLFLRHDEQDLHNRQDSLNPHDLHDEHDSQDQHDEHNSQDPSNQFEQYEQSKQHQKFFKETSNRSQVRRFEENKDNTSRSKKLKPTHKAREISKDPTETAPLSNIFETIGKQVLLGLARRYEENINNGNKRRIDRESKYSVDSKVLHKIRDLSSYSDEEINLKTHLYDTRPGN